jgi:hypothetical protein
MRYRKALAVFQKRADNNPAATGFRGRQAACHNNLGMPLSKRWRAVGGRGRQTNTDNLNFRNHPVANLPHEKLVLG